MMPIRRRRLPLAVLPALLGCAYLSPVSLSPPLPVPPPTKYQVDAYQSPSEKQLLEAEKAKPAPLDQEPRAAENRWWSAFDDPAMDALISEAFRNNFTIHDLRGLYHEDMLVPQMPNGPLWPLQVGLPVTAQRQAIGAPAQPGFPAYGNVQNEADIGLTATYQLDVFGQLATTRKGFVALAEIQGQSGEARIQDTAALIAQTWFDILTQRAMLELLERQIKLNEDLAALVKARFELHLTTRLAVLQQEQVLLNARAGVPIITERLALLGTQMTSLLARPPSPDTSYVPADRRLPDLLPSLGATGRPVDLVKNSPEVRLAQIRVAEAENSVQQNRSGWLPIVTLFANGGFQAFDLKNPFNVNHTSTLGNPTPGEAQTFETWSFGARLTWPLFDGGQRITEAKQFQMTVRRRNNLYLEAFYEAVRRVQDAQIEEQKQTANVKTLKAQVELGRQVLQEARQLYEQGLSDYLAVLTANANLSDLERALILSQRLLLSNRIDLYRALGGTWSKSIVDIVD
jgi:multidrug efflux system outer membrane protein